MEKLKTMNLDSLRSVSKELLSSEMVELKGGMGSTENCTFCAPGCAIACSTTSAIGIYSDGY